MRLHLKDGLERCKEIGEKFCHGHGADAQVAFVAMLQELVEQKMNFNRALIIHYKAFVEGSDKSDKSRAECFGALKAIRDWRPLLDKREMEGYCDPELCSTDDDVIREIGIPPWKELPEVSGV